MKSNILFVLICLLISPSTSEAQDLSRLIKIGSATEFAKQSDGLTVNCADGSQVQLKVLAPDLIRVRAAFAKTLDSADHSWAIAKESWPPVQWTVAESTAAITLKTNELVVNINRSPLLIEFRDLRTGEVINADQQPMMYDRDRTLNNMMFDPAAGMFIVAAKKLGLNEHFYGLGEKAAKLDKRRGSFVNWNSDTPGYSEGKDPIYQTIPFFIGLERGRSYGIFFDNSYRSHFNFGFNSQERIWFGAEGGEMNYYFFYGPSMKKVVSRYADLTGHMPLPPRWTLGNQQSRWSYYPDSLVEQVVAEYRRRDLPLDAIHLDIDYMDQYRVFTWNRDRFPDPKGLIDRLSKQGVKVVTIVDPGVKHQGKSSSSPGTGYYVLDQGLEKNYFQRRRNGDLFIPKVWPGASVFVDYTNPEARRWWGDLHRAYTDQGVAGIWNDMNEPADFVDQSGKNQLDVISYDEGAKTSHAKNRNVFALLMARATYEGLQRLQPDKRPYVITRAAYAGIQRYSTMWTGDTNSTWDGLALSVSMFATLGLSGEPFVGADVGGFMGRANGELLARAYQVSFLAPFCRNHKTIDSYDQEPWRFGKYYEDVIRKYLKLRYRLLPFLYTTLEESHRTGLPLFRPLVLNYPEDESTYNLDDQFMIGDDLLVAPVLKPDVTRRLVYLPKGIWYDYWTREKYQGDRMIDVKAPLDTVPMFVRGGAILPFGPEMNYVGEKPLEPTFVIYPDEQGAAQTSLYEDDGVSPAYLNGTYRRTSLGVSTTGLEVLIRVTAAEGSYQTSRRTMSFVLPFRANNFRVVVDGRALDRAAVGQLGWSIGPDGLTIRTTDDGQAHAIQVNQLP
ncbi:MAG TPA: glycoside hydrolase family 31 protein [Pyrinomonadaceae bacterium]|nr:glycoside hydrolase family 31 protein [Pyrinomonadaceae bacterium]